MSEYLDKKVMAYSVVNRTRCFNHILNLTGKSLLRQFDIKKKENRWQQRWLGRYINSWRTRIIRLIRRNRRWRTYNGTGNRSWKRGWGRGHEWRSWWTRQVAWWGLKWDEREGTTGASSKHSACQPGTREGKTGFLNTHCTDEDFSFANWPMPLSIPLPSSYRHGSCVLRSWSLQFE